MSANEPPTRLGSTPGTPPGAAGSSRGLVRLGGGLRRISGPPPTAAAHARAVANAMARAPSFLTLGQAPAAGATAAINQALRGLVGCFTPLAAGKGASAQPVQDALRAARTAVGRVQTGITPMEDAPGTIIPALEDFVRILSQQPGGLTGLEGALDECAGYLNAMLTAVEARQQELQHPAS